MHVQTVQLFGLAAGPALASFAVRPHDVTGAMLVGAGLFVSALILIIATLAHHRRTDPSPTMPLGAVPIGGNHR
jgi:hypothetical protein